MRACGSWAEAPGTASRWARPWASTSPRWCSTAPRRIRCSRSSGRARPPDRSRRAGRLARRPAPCRLSVVHIQMPLLRPLSAVLSACVAFGVGAVPAGAQSLSAEIDRMIPAVESKLIEWRRHFHTHPELSNRETETAAFIAERLRSLGLEPQTGIARTGVVAVLTGGLPGPTVALRADMDALPVREETDVPFASRATGEYEGNSVGVMHACGHDAHMAILLATAEVLTKVRDRLPGSVKFIFQPAEEGAPLDERPAGAELMVKEGVMEGVDAVFGLHVFANVPAGTITYRSGPFMAAADQFDIIVTGKQTHGSAPWRGVDPIVVGAQIVNALQTIVSRNVDITRLP